MKKTLFASLALMTALLACAIPGAPSASSPAPTTDPGRLETMVAETVSAALVMTEQAITPTPEPTSTPAASPTPETTEDSGSTLTKQEDGTTIFVDQRAGYSVIIPAGWLAVRVNEQEYYDAWSLAETANPRFQDSLLSIQNQDPDQLRLFALDTRDGHLVKDVVNNILFMQGEEDELSLDTDEDLQALADSQTESINGFKTLSVSITVLPNGMSVGVIESTTSGKNVSGEDIVLYQKQVFFAAKTGMVGSTLTVEESLKETLLPEFDAMISTITLIQE